jgi:hypothetical protein
MVLQPLWTHTQTSMPLVGFEPTIRVFERAKTVQVLDRAATVIGPLSYCCATKFVFVKTSVV